MAVPGGAAELRLGVTPFLPALPSLGLPALPSGPGATSTRIQTRATRSLLSQSLREEPRPCHMAPARTGADLLPTKSTRGISIGGIGGGGARRCSLSPTNPAAPERSAARERYAQNGHERTPRERRVRFPGGGSKGPLGPRQCCTHSAA
ncbi:Hypothetical predicted protein [Podarcis lilfordi]|uniref:Uncharacterized protein n=1 Tax=Podarcis lilfordi TaxID=74358 RepID=A0AA35KMQ7_9SAUR|nr:Hypothetical predicted protein [Podarcis lilfordi]